MDQFYFGCIFTQMKADIHFGWLVLRVAIYKSKNSLRFKSMSEPISRSMQWIKTYLLQSPLCLKQKQKKVPSLTTHQQSISTVGIFSIYKFI